MSKMKGGKQAKDEFCRWTQQYFQCFIALLQVHCLQGTFDESQLSGVTRTCELNICSCTLK